MQHAYILLDRTGSMQSIWDEALASVNSYADELKNGSDKGGDVAVTLAVFDHHNGFRFDLLRRAVPAEAWKAVSSEETSPRGMTPLFDAVGRIVALAEEDKPDRAVIVIMTDGHENASREVTMEGAKAALDRCEKRDWQVVFLGANFAQFEDAESLDVGQMKRMGVSSGNMRRSMGKLGRKSKDYFVSGSTVEFDEADREEAGENEIKK